MAETGLEPILIDDALSVPGVLLPQAVHSTPMGPYSHYGLWGRQGSGPQGQGPSWPPASGECEELLLPKGQADCSGCPAPQGMG